MDQIQVQATQDSVTQQPKTVELAVFTDTVTARKSVPYTDLDVSQQATYDAFVALGITLAVI